jgi:hypothetical protein
MSGKTLFVSLLSEPHRALPCGTVGSHFQNQLMLATTVFGSRGELSARRGVIISR